jgi:hypothetical protein
VVPEHLMLQGGEERLARSAIEAGPDSSHRLLDRKSATQHCEIGCTVSLSTISVEDHAIDSVHSAAHRRWPP